MATARLMFRMARPPLPFGLPSSSSSSSASASLSGTTVRCVSKAGFIEADDRKSKSVCGDGERKPVAAVKASTAATSELILRSELRVGRGILLSDLAFLVANIIKAAMSTLRSIAVKQRRLRLYVQLFIERAIINCRFFTLFAVVGSLFGSVLCFLEGCFTMLESYLRYFHSSHKSNQEHVMQLLIEAIDMFLVGTAMLMFGMGLYVIFVGKKTMTGGPRLSGSNLFGLFYMKTLPAWVEMQSISQAKSKIGHAVMMILQVGILDKLKNIPLVSGLDLACFAGAVLISSASIFLLSRLSAGSDTLEYW